MYRGSSPEGFAKLAPMSEFFSNGQWIVAVLTGVFALGGSWYGSRLGRITEQRQWLRNEKKKHYIEAIDYLGRKIRIFDDHLNMREVSVPSDREPADTSFLTPLLTLAPLQVRMALTESVRTAEELTAEMHESVIALHAAVSAGNFPEHGIEQWQQQMAASHRRAFDAADRAMTAMRKDLGVMD